MGLLGNRKKGFTSRFFVVLLAAFGVFGLLFLRFAPLTPASARTTDECMNAARANSNLAGYVDANYATFYSRCEQAHGGGYYGMIFIYNTSIPEISSNTSFSKPLRRTVLSNSTSVDTRNAYVCTSAGGISMSSNMAGQTSGTAGTFSDPTGSGTVTVSPGDISWTNNSGKYSYEFEYTSCTNASSCSGDTCATMKMTVYHYRVAYPSGSSWVSSVEGATRQADGRYKTTNGYYKVNFGHSVSSNKAWDSSITGGLHYCAATGTSSGPDCTIGSNADTSSSHSATLANDGDSVTVYSRVKFPNKVGLGGYSPSNSATYSSQASVTIYREDPRYNYYLYYDACGGSGAPGTQSETNTTATSRTFTVSSTKPSKGEDYDFIGWSTTSCSGSVNAGSTVGVTSSSPTATLYAIYRPVYWATFSGSIEVAPKGGTNVTGSGTSFRADGYHTTGFGLTTTYKVTRSNNTPAISATSRLGYASYEETSIAGNASHYPSSSSTSTSLTNGNSRSIPVDYGGTTTSYSVANGSTIYPCFYLSFDNRVGYVWNGSSYVILDSNHQKFDGRAVKCVSLYNPNKYDATFTGSISAANGNYISGTGTARVGNGLYGQYNLTPTYTVTRTNNIPNWAVAPQYAYATAYGTRDDSKYPTSATGTMDALSIAAGGKVSDSRTASATTIPVNIDGSATQCFYLSYDNTVIYLDTSLDKRVFNGRTPLCITLTNPHQEYTANFSASSDGSLDSHDQLSRTNSNRTGIINNLRRKSGNNNNTDGQWEYNYPSSSEYTASFTHTIKRTDSDGSANAATTYYVSSAKVSWEVQYCNDAACLAGTYSKYVSSADKNSNVSISGDFYLTAGATSSTTTKPKWTLGATQKGMYVYQCQRIAYSSSTSYKTTTNTSNRNTHNDTITGYGSTAYSTPVCVTLKNPRWDESTSSYHDHYIDVDGATGSLTTSGVRSNGSNSYETLKINVDFLFDHSLARHDNLTVAGRNTTNFDETDAGQSTFVEQYKSLFGWSSVANAYFQPSIYNNSNYAVSTKMWGNERLPGTRNNAKLINPIQNTTGTINGYPATLNATNKTTGGTWASTAANGRTKTSFNASGSGDYSLMAGDTKRFSHSTYNNRAAWKVAYKKIARQEVYLFWASRYTGSQYYDRTEIVSAAPRLCVLPNGVDRACGLSDTTQVQPIYRDSANPTTYTVTRPYNFIITGSKHDASTPTSWSTNTFTVSYTLDIGRENTDHEYITDPNHTGNSRYVYVIGYTVDKNVNYTSSTTINITHGTSNFSGSLCSFFSGIAKNCSVLSDSNGSHPTKLSKYNSTFDPGTAWNHVYTTWPYKLTYTTATITIPESTNVGDKYCVAIAVRNYSSASSNYYISTSSCKNATKRPNLQVWGGHTLSAGGIKTTTITRNSVLFGSWSDYLISANKPIKQMASGATMISGMSSSSLCNRSPLTIANSKCSSETAQDAIGKAGVSARADVFDKLLEYLSSSLTSVSALPGYNSSTNTHYISGNSYIIRTDGDLTIDRNIVLTGSYHNSNVPHIVIIAKNINIDQKVTRLDAMLVATSGTIDTCMNYTAAQLNSARCTNQLTINGPVVTGKILLKRTANGDPKNSSVASPAELINYDPSTILWGYSRAMANSDPNIVYVRELPPRY